MDTSSNSATDTNSSNSNSNSHSNHYSNSNGNAHDVDTSDLASGMEGIRVMHINKEIAKFADRKDLDSAVTLYLEAVEGGYANTHTFCSVLNAYVRCGAMDGALTVVEEMKKRKFKLDVVSFTTLMKGFCNDGEIFQAYGLFREMELAQPKVVPNVRSVNTFLRGCVTAAELLLADKVFLTCKEWSVAGDISTYEYMSQLYCQALNQDKVLPLLGRLPKEPSMAIGLAAINLNVARTKALLGDWKGCRKHIKLSLEFVEMDEGYEGDSGLTEAAGEAGTSNLSGGAIGGKRAWHTKDDAENTRKESLDRFRVHRRNELKFDLDMLGQFASRFEGQKGGSHLVHVLPLVVRMLCFFKLNKPIDYAKLKAMKNKNKNKDKKEEKSGGESAAAAAPAPEETVKQNMLDSFQHRLGLPILLKQAEKVTGNANFSIEFMSRLEEGLSLCSSTSSAQFNFGKFDSFVMNTLTPWMKSVFDGPAASSTAATASSSASIAAPRLMKMEIGSGAGEWAAAQAAGDPSCHWLTLELRFDRSYQTLTKGIYAGVNNLTVLCGDANKVVKESIADASVDQIFINHPEPPQQTGSLHNPESQGRHLLTKKFFTEIFRILKPEGTFTLVTDNHWYSKYLLRQLSTTAYPRPFASVSLQAVSSVESKREWTHVESEGGIDLYEGKPGSDCGHVAEASSYFDRLWKGERINERYFFFLKKQHVAAGPMGPVGSIKPKKQHPPAATRAQAHGAPADSHRGNDRSAGKVGGGNKYSNSHSHGSDSKFKKPEPARAAPVPTPAPVEEIKPLTIRGRFKGTALAVDPNEVKTKKIKFDDDDE